MNNTKLLAAAVAAALTLALAGCGGSPSEPSPAEGRYYVIEDADGKLVHAAADPETVETLLELTGEAAAQPGEPGEGGGEPLWTYVLYEGGEALSGGGTESFREMLRVTVCAGSDTVTVRAVPGAEALLPAWAAEGESLTVHTDAPAAAAEKLRDADAFADGADSMDPAARSYYAGQESAAREILAGPEGESLLAGWIGGNFSEAAWELETFAAYQYLDEGLIPMDEGELYICGFSTRDGETGHVVMRREGEELTRSGVAKTDGLYDLRARLPEIRRALQEAEMDFDTLTAQRVREESGAESIFFNDGQGRGLLCRFEDGGITAEPVT